MAPVFFRIMLSLDHQGKGTGPNDDHKRNAHKEIFHVSPLRVVLIRSND